MQSLDQIFTNNSYQGVFDIICDEEHGVKGTFVYATRIIQKWIQLKFKGSIPDKPRTFHWERASRKVDIIYDFDNMFFCAKAVHNDSNVPDKTWITEVEISRKDLSGINSVLKFAVKNQFTSDYYTSDYKQYSVPSFVRRLDEKVGLYDAGQRVKGLNVISSKDDLEELTIVLDDASRFFPVIIISQDEINDPAVAHYFEADEGYYVDGNKFAESLSLLGHVYYLPLEYQYELGEMLGREWAIFNGAVRTYYPGFSIDKKDEMNTYDHPFIAKNKILSMEYIKEDDEQCYGGHAFRHILTHITKVENMSRRVDWNKYGIDLYYIASKKEQARSENEINQIKESDSFYQELCDTLEQEKKQQELEIDYLKNQLKEAKNTNSFNQLQISQLKNKIKELQASANDEYPTQYSEIQDWVEKNFSGRITLHKRAIKCINDNPVYPDVELLCKSIEMLGTAYYDLKMGFSEDRNACRDLCNQLGIINCATDSEKSSGTQKKSYEVDYQGGRRRLDMHVKGGKSINSHDDTERFRIYYFWDDDNNRVVIGYLPGHLHTDQS